MIVDSIQSKAETQILTPVKAIQVI